jgi:ParB-like chromosome segregation protein Spo0J
MIDTEVKIGEIKANPNNPRIIKDDKFKKLVKSIQEFPEMLKLRPIVVNDDMVVLGGNMRLKACKEAGLKSIPIIKASLLTEEQQKEFIVKDNVGYGEWDWDDLANNWDAEQLTDWGLDIPNYMELPSEDELIQENENKPPTMKITFESVEDLQQAEIDITELIDRKFPKAYFSVSAGEL